MLNSSLKDNLPIRAKNILLAIIFLAILVTVISATLLQIEKRSVTNPVFYVHDGVIQVEEAIKFVLKGKNPYTENYFNTPLENWGGLQEFNGVNPALYHLVYLPFNIIFSIPFFLIGNFLLSWFDERFVYILSFLLTIILILKWKDKSLFQKLIFLIIFTFNPLFYSFFIEGRNDIFVFSWIVLAIYLLKLNKVGYSSMALAAAATSKQSSWFLLPFYFAYLYYNQSDKLAFLKKIKNVLKETKAFFITTLVIIAPFLLWNITSFIDDVIKYPNGTAYMSFPIKGMGFQQFILESRVVNSAIDYWPFWIPELIFGLPILYILLKMQKRNNTLGQTIFSFSLLLMTFWFFSRFFNNNYVGFLSMLLLFAFFVNEKILNIKHSVKLKSQ